MPDDYLDRAGLLALGLDEAFVDRLLRDTPLTANDGRPVVEADQLDKQLDLLDGEGRTS